MSKKLNKIGTFNGIKFELDTFEIKDVIIIRVDTNNWDLDTAQFIYNEAAKAFPNKPIIVLPMGLDTDIETRWIDDAIRTLEIYRMHKK